MMTPEQRDAGIDRIRAAYEWSDVYELGHAVDGPDCASDLLLAIPFNCDYDNDLAPFYDYEPGFAPVGEPVVRNGVALTLVEKPDDEDPSAHFLYVYAGCYLMTIFSKTEAELVTGEAYDRAIVIIGREFFGLTPDEIRAGRHNRLPLALAKTALRE